MTDRKTGMVTLDEAIAAYATEVHPLPVHEAPPLGAAGHVLAEAARAGTDLPRFDQSALDGYCFCAADTAAATPEQPVRLPIAQTVVAQGHAEWPRLAAGTAARIFTGALLPAGADAMQAQERAQVDAGALLIGRPFPVGNNIRRRGEELAQGTVLAEAGQRITPTLLASLVNAEVGRVRVHRRPIVRVLVSGDEVRPAGTPLAPGEIHDSNGPLVAGLLRRRGIDVRAPIHLGDDPATVREALQQALDEADLVISTGGASVGDRDFLPASAEALGVRRVFWKVAQKPGKPLYFGVRDAADTRRALMLALPGNPGAVLIGMVIHARLVLDFLEGIARPSLGWAAGVLDASVDRDRQRTRLLRMQQSIDVSGVVRLSPLPLQDSHMLSNLGRADVLVRVEPGEASVPAGSVLPWMPLPA